MNAAMTSEPGKKAEATENAELAEKTQLARLTMREIMSLAPVMPVLTIHDVSLAGPLAPALVEGGIRVFEVVMRTPAALPALRDMQRATPEAMIGVGTLLNADDVARAVDAGAAFGVSPGCTAELAAAVLQHGLPMLPGVATASEIMRARDLGFKELKFFPAQGAAGIAWLRDMASVFPDVLLCPTGGIRPADIPGYLALPNCCILPGPLTCN